MRLPLAPWLWPLLLPALLALGLALLPLLILWDWRPRNPGALPGVLALMLGTLTLVLVPALIALRVLRVRAACDGVVRPRLAAFRGLCLGLSGAVLLGAGALTFGLPSGGGAALLPVCCLLLPALGYAVGRVVRPKR